ncbi:ABC transporter permease [Runella sp. MFBS21]|uniref:ABC transporter permease n=1 Tax=Runella sp. MFBS21 TaxID=3034018 RepID=UPI0023F8320E|nr:ABC transporter permease [Runella sp. MFBS21]MDF7815951.1 ABC transporter permease [Runella sp. MFBS21]
MQHTPPRWAKTLLKWWAAPNTSEEVEGDLLELYNHWVATVGERKANWNYTLNAIKLLRPFAKDQRSQFPRTYLYSPTMIRNYFKIAFRNLLKHKGYSFINVAGLAIGMTVAMLIGLWIYDELSFNQYHRNYERIGQIRSISTEPSTGVSEGSPHMPIPMGAALKENYKHLFSKVLVSWAVSDYTLKLNEKNLTGRGHFVEPGILEMLSLKMLKGSYGSLKDPHSIVLSKSMAAAIFGSTDPINQSLKIDNAIDVKVTGVYEDMPKNSRFGEVQFFSPWDLFVSSNAWVKENVNFWGNTSFGIYVELQPNVSLETAQAGLKDFYAKNVPTDFMKLLESYKPEIFVYSMPQWHLYSDFTDGRPAGGRVTFVWLFGIIGISVLLLASINFMNLSTARSEKRAKEVGIRKAVGSLRTQLIGQFFSESFLVVLLSFVISCGLIILALRWFNELADKAISLPFTNGYFWAGSIAFILLTGLLTGIYPALYLSSFQPLKVLKGTFKAGRFAAVPRKALVVVQFTVSVVIIIGTMVVYQQIQHAKNRPVGYNQESLITIGLNDPNYKDKYDVFKRELLNTGAVSNVALSNSPLTSIWNRSSGFTWKDKAPETPSGFNKIRVTSDFGKTIDWKIIAGRDFSDEYKSDSAGVILNEAAAKYIGLKNPIGEYIKTEDGKFVWQIVGVTKDMVIQSPYEPINGTFYFLDSRKVSSQMTIRIKPTVGTTEALAKIETVFRKLVPSAPFDYKFVDDVYSQKFSQEQRIGQLSMLFAVLAIFISCLGLFGLASFVAEQRTKEIGIRKVLGASVSNVWQMLSKDFVILVIIACVIAAPIAYYFMNEWLQKYTYRTEISWWIFAAAGVGALIITLLTVSFQAIKAALMNPVQSLKSE